MDEALLGKTTAKGSSDSYYLKNGSIYWLSSPFNFYSPNAIGYGVDSTGLLRSDYVYNTYGVRPALSLRTGVVYSEGDGSKDSPYIIETN